MNLSHTTLSAYVRTLLIGLMAVLAVPAMAAGKADMLPPDQLITNLFNEVSQRVKQDEAKIIEDKSHLVQIGEELLVPYVSFETMAKQILGKNWRKITSDQQKRYTIAFKERVSSTIVAQYDPGKDYELQITGFRTNDAGDRAAVNSELTEKQSGKKYQISYRLFVDKKLKRWQVYDVAADGVSVLQSFKSASAEDFKRNGIEYMIAQLSKAPEPEQNGSSQQAKQ